MRRIAMTVVVLGLACSAGEKKGDGGAADKSESKAEPDSDSNLAGEPEAGDEAEQMPSTDGVDKEPTNDEGGEAAPEWLADIEVLVDAQGTRLRIAADRSGDDSIVWGQPIDVEGKAMAPPTKLRGTKGSVESIDAVFDGQTLWVGWRSRVAEDRGMEALAGFNPELAPMANAQSLRFYEGGDPDPNGAILLVARAGVAQGVAVAALVGTKKCEGMFMKEEGKVDCTQLALDLVAPDGKVEHSSVTGLEGGEPSLDDLVATEKGVAASMHAWRGGPMTSVVYLSDTGKSSEPSSCGYPPIDLAWAGGGLLSLCSDPDREEGSDEACGPKTPGACGLIHLAAVEGKPKVAPTRDETPVTGLELRCEGDEQLAKVSWKGGAVELPARALGLHTKDGCGG